MGRSKYDDSFKAKAVRYARYHTIHAAAVEFNVNDRTVKKWLEDSDARALQKAQDGAVVRNGPGVQPRVIQPAESKQEPTEEKDVQDGIHENCPYCGHVLKGIFVPEGSPIDDLHVIYSMPGTVDLGSKRKQERGRTTGHSMRSDGQKSRTGRREARLRKEEEIA